MGNPTKRALWSTSSNSPTYVDKKNKVFVTPNRSEVLEMEEQDNVFVQTESQLTSQTTKTSPEPNKIKLPNIVLMNVTDFIIIIKDLTSIVGPEDFTCKANRSNIIHSTDKCTKKREEPAKCANCDGNHTANYKGCQALKKILNRTKPKAKKINKENRPIPTLAIPSPSRRSGNEAPSSNSTGLKLSYAEIAANKPPPDQSLHIITKFLVELKSLLNPLLTVLTSLIKKITFPITPTP
ncbi:hypothetical protein QTP88_026064 [Uroleucon formosanum]